MMCSVLISEPPADVPYATYLPSCDGTHQSSATVPSFASSFTSTSTSSLPVDALADVEHRLVLRAFAAGVEVVRSADFDAAEIADLEQLLEAGAQLIAAGQLVENAARVGKLCRYPLLGLGTAAVFQPSIVVDNLVAVVVVGDGLLLGGGRLWERSSSGRSWNSVPWRSRSG